MNEIKKTLKLIAKFVNSNRISEKELYSYYEQLINIETDDPRKEIILNNIINKLLEIDPLYIFYLKIDDEELIKKYKRILIKRNLGICDVKKEIKNFKILQDDELIELSIKKNPKKTLEVFTKNGFYVINEDLIKLKDLLIKYDYIIDEDTPIQLLICPDLQYHSYQLDKESIHMLPAIISPELVEMIFREHIIELYDNISVTYLDRIEEYEDNKDIIELILNEIKKDLTISNALRLSKQYAILNWEDYKKEYYVYFLNVREKTFKLLEELDNFKDFEAEFELFNSFETVYGKEYIINIFKKYFKAKRENNTELLKTLTVEIEKICRLYLGKLRDKTIKESMETLKGSVEEFYFVKINSKKVNKLLKEKKQRDLFTKQYLNNEYPDLLDKIFNSIKKSLKVEYQLTDEEIKELIQSALTNRVNINEPDKYQLLLKTIEVNKIINRLNSVYINENDKDYINNQEYITSKIINGKKVYSIIPIDFTINELNECKKYISQLTVIKLSNNTLMPIIKKLDVEISDEDLDTLELEFTDDNFEFDRTLLDVDSNIGCIRPYLDALIRAQKNVSKEDFNELIKFLVDNQIFITTILLNICFNEEEENNKLGTNQQELIDIIYNYHKLIHIFDLNKLDIDHYSEIVNYTNIVKSISLRNLSILGMDLAETIVNDDSFNLEGATIENKITRTVNLYTRMITKNNFTVPRISGKVGEINYSIMEQNDPHLLKCGYETDACFRPCGHDNDFLHYCCLNPNGFVIKLTDKEGNFLGRAAGFRSGNGIFLNQLRTIYDESGDYNYSTKEFTMKLALALKECCDQIISKTTNSKEPIDFVIINQAYCLEILPSNIFGEAKTTNEFQLKLKIANPIYVGENYKEFLTLDGVQTKKKFTTDYSNHYRKIVISSRKPLLDIEDYKEYDAIPCYHRNRSEVIDEVLTEENYYEINKIRLIKQRLNNKDKLANYELINKEYIGCQVIHGDNWYIIHDGNKILDFECIEQDEYAAFECKKYLLLYFEKTKTI